MHSGETLSYSEQLDQIDASAPDDYWWYARQTTAEIHNVASGEGVRAFDGEERAWIQQAGFNHVKLQIALAGQIGKLREHDELQNMQLNKTLAELVFEAFAELRKDWPAQEVFRQRRERE